VALIVSASGTTIPAAARTAAGTGLLAWASSVLRKGRNRSRPSVFDPVDHNRRNQVERGFNRR
jgi:hypothetical protein